MAVLLLQMLWKSAAPKKVPGFHSTYRNKTTCYPRQTLLAKCQEDVLTNEVELEGVEVEEAEFYLAAPWF